MNKLGFGFLRLPRLDPDDEKSIDYAILNRMVDTFISGGGRYFDTAYTYTAGMSEPALRESLVKRYPRDAFEITDKLPSWMVKSREDCRRFFDEQCERCGVDYFDAYLLHWLSPKHYEIAEKFDEFAFLRELKEEGRVGRIGFSYHGDSALLERILDAHPEVELVQLQINYLDRDDPGIESQKCYELAAGRAKEVVVMEPLKGGTLAKLPDEAQALLDEFNAKNDKKLTPASLGFAYAESFDAVSVVLSGMSSCEMIVENLQSREALGEREYELIDRIREILTAKIAVPCTGCRYCVSHCPKSIAIPEYFALYNSNCRYPGERWKTAPVYGELAKTHKKASDCISCRKCEQNCPQSIRISELLPEVAKVFEK